MSQQRALATGLESLDLALSADVQARLLAYLALLDKWNRTYNLTAVRDPAAMVSRHVLDSLAVSPWLQGPRIIDVGTGAGLPGIPLALAHPHWQFVLLDSRRKRTRFVTQAVSELGLSNVHVVAGRVEDYAPDAPFQTVISRAFSQLADFVSAVGRLVAAEGRLLAMKAHCSAADTPPAHP